MAWSRPRRPSEPVGRPLADAAGAGAPGEVEVAVEQSARPPRRRSRWGLGLWLLGVLLVILVMTVHVPYAILSPGPAVNTLGNDGSGSPLIDVTKAKTFPTTGSLDFTTVTVRGGPGYPVTAFDVLAAKLQPHNEVLPADSVFRPDASADEVKAENSMEMQSSQENATVVALRALGHEVPEQVVIASVPDRSPAHGLLHADDVVTKVDGVATPTSGAARKAIQKHGPGEKVTLTVLRKGTAVDVPLTTIDSEGTTIIGVLLRSRYTFPVDVKITAGDVGGPSAGTMFALGVYDKLTPGALTGGRQIAGTGAIDPDGTVEPIGGVAEKMVAARRAGAEWFLAPASNCAEVVGNIPDGLHVAKMATFDEAVRAVTAIGKGSTSSVPSCG